MIMTVMVMVVLMLMLMLNCDGGVPFLRFFHVCGDNHENGDNGDDDDDHVEEYHFQANRSPQSSD